MSLFKGSGAEIEETVEEAWQLLSELNVFDKRLNKYLDAVLTIMEEHRQAIAFKEILRLTYALETLRRQKGLVYEEVKTTSSLLEQINR